MRKLSIVSRLLLTAGLMAGTLLSNPSFGQDNRSAPAVERQWLSIPQIHDRLEAAGYRHIEKIERERGSYEVRATGPSGQRVKLYVNPTTGEIFDRFQAFTRRNFSLRKTLQRAWRTLAYSRSPARALLVYNLNRSLSRRYAKGLVPPHHES